MKLILAMSLAAMVVLNADAASVLVPDPGQETLRTTTVYVVVTPGIRQVVRLAPTSSASEEPRKVIQIRQSLGRATTL